MQLNIILAVFISFAVSAAVGPFLIPALRRLKFGQTEREELTSHHKKAGTPTMGGIMIILGILVASLVFARSYPGVVPVLILTLGFGIIGFIDDYLKVVKKSKDGLIAWQKLILEFLVTIGFILYTERFLNMDFSDAYIPFTGGAMMHFSVLTVPFVIVAVLGTVNAVNFTDGLDGLASSVTFVVAAFLTFLSLMEGAGIEPVTAAVCGALMGFLLFNAYPAKVFMGDTGSLALGGFVAASAFMMRIPWFILLFGLIYFVEILSVMIQVTYFKLTHGKRIFKMSPIHHHFELCGWSETKIVTVFTVITVLMCLISLIAFKPGF
ncbi:MAG: phospho-N-acetylmuramoyl-pentapeptide-transferase [Lachnospiraceae bacterium]|nr:phospho-N-acetylmuramoyl-pentapeptide-transferase [Lachnospiraceae bacterium]